MENLKEKIEGLSPTAREQLFNDVIVRLRTSARLTWLEFGAMVMVAQASQVKNTMAIIANMERSKL